MHGSGPGVSGWANFSGNLPLFAEHFRTLVLDLPGFGRSHAVDGPPILYAQGAVLSFLDGLGIDRLAMVGNSLGGGVVAGIAASNPDRVSRLVTLGGVGVPFFSPLPPEGIIRLVEFTEDPTREKLVQWMRSMVFDPAVLTDEFVETRWAAAKRSRGARRHPHDLQPRPARRVPAADAREPGAADDADPDPGPDAADVGS